MADPQTTPTPERIAEIMAVCRRRIVEQPERATYTREILAICELALQALEGR